MKNLTPLFFAPPCTSLWVIIMFYWLRLLAPQDLCWGQLILSFRWQEPHPMTVHRELYLSNMYFFICDLKEQNDIALFVTFSISSFGAVCKNMAIQIDKCFDN